MRAGDRLPRLRGELEYWIHRAGEMVEHVRESNLVVANADAVLAALLGGVANKEIAKLGVGTDGTAPAAGDVGLTNQVLVALGDVSFPEAGSVAFEWTLAPGQANGLAIREFGLFTEDDNLVARKVREEAIDKTAEVSLVGTWTLYF